VRDAEWASSPLNDLDVPGAVVRGFTGTSESFCRINDESARRFTPYVWEKIHGRDLPRLGITSAEILASHLDWSDVEDLVYVWLQYERGYLALPRTRQRDTPAYEYTMLHRESGRRAIAQVKTGSEAVDLDALAAARVDTSTNTFAFATSGAYLGDATAVTEVIAAEELLLFARNHSQLLPPRVRLWFELANS
jgi:hypothetical protein